MTDTARAPIICSNTLTDKAAKTVLDVIAGIRDAIPRLMIAEVGKSPSSIRLVHGGTYVIHRDFNTANEGVELVLNLGTRNAAGKFHPRIRLVIPHPAAADFHPLAPRTDTPKAAMILTLALALDHVQAIIETGMAGTVMPFGPEWTDTEITLEAVASLLAETTPGLDLSAGVEVVGPAPWRQLDAVGMVPGPNGPVYAAIHSPLAAPILAELDIPQVIDLHIGDDYSENAITVTITPSCVCYRDEGDPIARLRLAQRIEQLRRPEPVMP